METYENERTGYDQWLTTLGVLTILTSFLTAPMFPFRRTRGANATEFLGKNGKPVLMELKNCRKINPPVGPKDASCSPGPAAGTFSGEAAPKLG